MTITLNIEILLATIIAECAIVSVWFFVQIWDMWEYNTAAKAYIKDINNEPMVRYTVMNKVMSEKEYEAIKDGIVIGVGISVAIGLGILAISKLSKGGKK